MGVERLAEDGQPGVAIQLALDRPMPASGPAVCTEKSNPRVVMVKSAQDGVRTYENRIAEPAEKPAHLG